MYAHGSSREEMAQALGKTPISIKRMITTAKWKRDPNYRVDPAIYNTKSERWIRTRKYYAVSSRGRVMSLYPGNIGNIISQWVDDDGYSHVTLQLDGKPKRLAVHRLIARAFHGKPPQPHYHAAHNDGVPKNNFDYNIRWATPKENFHDRVKHGRAPRVEVGRHKGKFEPVGGKGTANMVTLAKERDILVYEQPGRMPDHTKRKKKSKKGKSNDRKLDTGRSHSGVRHRDAEKRTEKRSAKGRNNDSKRPHVPETRKHRRQLFQHNNGG